MGKAIDRKYKFTGVSLSSGKAVSATNGMVFLARDPALPAALTAYQAKCQELGASPEQLEGVQLLRERVEAYQAKYPKRVKVADVKPGREAQRILKPNQE